MLRVVEAGIGSLLGIIAMLENGATFVFADASYHYLGEDISPEVLRALSTPNGGVPNPDY
jgi:hypothetical protein